VTADDHDQRSDEQLIDAANRGDAEAFETLYARYRDWVVDVAFRFTGDRQLALDAMQEAFLYLLRKFPGFKLRAKLTTFLYPVVKHTARHLARSARRTESAGEGGGAASRADPDVPHGELRAAVDALPEHHREVLLLRYADDLPIADIAAALGIAEGTVKSRLHHAVATLRGDDRLKDFFDS
jgi:RNA polymerase sigma-70 factor (ECF subfamily)